MDAARAMQISAKLQGLKGAELERVAAGALADCEDADCRNTVLVQALTRAGQAADLVIPKHVGEGHRLALSTGSAGLTGLARGLFGELWGRLAAGVPAIAGLALGLGSKDPSAKAAGFAILGGASNAMTGIETRDLGEIIAAKVSAKVTTRKTTANQPAAQ